eukprot:TRINITY_DN88954_c0_g1_i1.p1 TRINITY_DN88954_c0_g1~~TRINITY_DN88954_c0_g1_i1.p1  ORF type:complete len:333 (+),score=55.58 TRINITY_DN88954_c0_g1_i1:144-1142(+)
MLPWSQLAVHGGYLSVMIALLFSRHHRQPPLPTSSSLAEHPHAQESDTQGACSCEVPSISYSSPEIAATLVQHIARNVPLRVTGVPQDAAPLLDDDHLRNVAGNRVVELRAVDAGGRVAKRSGRQNATLGEALQGGKLAASWYAAQISVPNALQELAPLIQSPALPSPSEESLSWADVAGKPLKASPYLYYYGGGQQHAAGDGPALYIHYDAAENLVQVLDGWKEFWLYDPFQSAQVLYGSNKEYGNASPVDVDSPNATVDFPLFKHALPRKCTLRAGEWLYVPLFWWHRVRSSHTRSVSLTHFNRGDRDKKGFFQKIMCGYSLKPAAFECG